MSTAAKEIADVHTESTDVGSSLTRDPEDAHISVFIVFNELGLVDGSDTELFFDS